MSLVFKLLVIAALIYGAMQLMNFKDAAKGAIDSNQRVFGDKEAVMSGEDVGEERKDTLRKVVK